MTLPLLSLLAFAMWTIGLVGFGIGPMRFRAMARKEIEGHQIRAEKAHEQLSERYQRLHRAHLNCVENLPVFAAIVLVAHVSGVRSGAFDALAVAVVVLRICQSVSHIVAGRGLMLTTRFSAFVLQLLAMVAMTAIAVMTARGT